MANVFTGSPVILDTVWTAGTIPAALTAELNNSPQRFKRIVWTGATAAGTCVFTDINGNILFSEVCPVTGQDVVLWGQGETPYSFKQSKYVLLTLGSGTIKMYR